MAIQLLFNGGLALFFVYCYFYIDAIARSLSQYMDGAQWPQILLILLIIFLIANMYKIYKCSKEERNHSSITAINFKELYRNKLFIGIVLLFIYAFALDYLGFILSSFLLCVAYSRLLGEKRIPQLLLYSFLSVATLYIIFSKCLSIILPRGVGILRKFALMLERI